MAMLKVENLSISFGGLKAVDNLSFEIEKGQIYGLIGPNGAGKTTVFNCITSFYKPNTGKVIFDGKDISNKKAHQMIEAGIARTFQNVELFKYMTVLDNLMVGQHSSTKHGIFSGAFMLPFVKKEEENLKQRALEVMDFLGIRGTEYLMAGAQPYGVQKLIELGRALVSKPKMLILDEPAAGMNSTETLGLSQLIKKIRDELGMTILLVEHDMSLVMGICEKICVLNFGSKIAQGSPEEIQKNPVVQEAYLGEEDIDATA